MDLVRIPSENWILCTSNFDTADSLLGQSKTRRLDRSGLSEASDLLLLRNVYQDRLFASYAAILRYAVAFHHLDDACNLFGIFRNGLLQTEECPYM